MHKNLTICLIWLVTRGGCGGGVGGWAKEAGKQQEQFGSNKGLQLW